MNAYMPLLHILCGIVILILGRQLFWLFVGIVGFLFGFDIATQYLGGQPEWIILCIAIGTGLIGAILSYFLQWLAFGLAGFYAGGYITDAISNSMGWKIGTLPGLSFGIPAIIGGIIGFILIIIFLNWGLIILSSIVGATLITKIIPLPVQINMLIFILLVIIGIVIQGTMLEETKQ